MKPDLIRPEIATLPTYNAGLALDRFQALYGTRCRAKLDSNENPLGPCHGAVEAIRAEAAGIARYPDAGNAALRAELAEATGATPDRIIIGNGSEDLIGALFRTVLRPGDHLVTVCPSFGLHEFGARACGAHVTKVPFAPDWSFPLDGLTRAMAVDLGKEGITVNCVCPGPVRTGITEAIPEEAKQTFANRRTALRRYAEPEEVAHATLSLVLPAASFITGATLLVDGGVTIRNA